MPEYAKGLIKNMTRVNYLTKSVRYFLCLLVKIAGGRF